MNDKPQWKWTVIKEFEDKDIIVEVSVSDSARPRYSMRVGKRGERGVIPFMPVYVQGQGKVQVVSLVDTVGRLLDEAEKFIEGEAQKYEDRFIAERLEREERQVAREGKKRRPSGYKGHGKSSNA